MNNRGFTLIELLLSASLLPVILLLFLYLINSSAAMHQQADYYYGSLASLRSEMEKAREMTFDQLALSDGVPFCSGAGRMTVTPVAEDLLKVELRLQNDPRRPPIILCSLRSKY